MLYKWLTSIFKARVYLGTFTDVLLVNRKVYNLKNYKYICTAQSIGLVTLSLGFFIFFRLLSRGLLWRHLFQSCSFSVIKEVVQMLCFTQRFILWSMAKTFFLCLWFTFLVRLAFAVWRGVCYVNRDIIKTLQKFSII